jgi:beta-glucosidase
MKYTLIIWLTLLTALHVTGQTIDERVDSLLELMTLEEKVGQMTQIERIEVEENMEHLATYGIGSVLSGGGSAPSPNAVASWSAMYDSYQNTAMESRLGIPILYGIDAVHGHSNVYGAVIFPHNIGLGCTWNPELVREANEITAREVAATGIDWTFAPCVAVARNERWGRTYEGFGETAEINELMAAASVAGLQGSDLADGETILACAKHYVGDGGTTDGIDQGNTQVSEQVLRDVHMAPYIDAIDAGVGTIMATYNSWNGEKVHGIEYLLTDVLKDELGFEGFIISDWKGVDQVDEDYRTAIKRAINAGIDMVMVPDRYEVFTGHLTSLVNDGEVSMERIDDAVRRILRQKYALNLFEEPLTDPSLAATVGSQEHRDVARQAVRESMVLLNAKNDVLPLKKDGQRILVAGALASDVGAQCGGWTIAWQGGNGNITQGTTILQGIQSLAASSEVIYSVNGDHSGDVDVAVVVVGEKIPYAEGAGDRSYLVLDQEDIEMVRNLKESGIPVIAVLVSGRPLVLAESLPHSDAFLAAWFPGTEGSGIAEVLFGDYAPKGMLTHSWPRNMSQVPINFGDDDYEPLFAYRHGLQEFPESAAAVALLPYAAATDPNGNKIILALSDKITAMDAAPGDFEVTVNGAVQAGIVTNVEVASYDAGILELRLNAQLDPADELTLAYTGGGISASGLDLGQFTDYFVYNSSVDIGPPLALPGRVEAEDYFIMSGIQLEATTDVGGGQNVGYIDWGDWLKYHVIVGQSGTYEITCRIAGYQNGALRFKFNDDVEFTVGYTTTNGWQNWQDFKKEIVLDEGQYIMEVIAQSNAFNINYFDFELLMVSAVYVHDRRIQEIAVFPNPMNDALNVAFNNTTNSRATIRLIDYAGKWSQELYSGSLQAGQNNFTFPIDSTLATGIYFVEIKDEVRRYYRKVVRE